MKKLTLYSVALIFTIVLFSACNATKKGCGLTSDTNKIQQISTNNLIVVANTK